MTHALPTSFVEKGLRLAEGSTLFGKSFQAMSRDELIAAAAQGWAAERRQREDGAERVQNALAFAKATRGTWASD